MSKSQIRSHLQPHLDSRCAQLWVSQPVLGRFTGEGRKEVRTWTVQGRNSGFSLPYKYSPNFHHHPPCSASCPFIFPGSWDLKLFILRKKIACALALLWGSGIISL